MSVPYRPQSQGIVERLNAEVMRHLRAFILPLKDATVWPTYLPLVQRLLNSAIHSTTGVSPAQLLYGNAIDLDRHLFPSTAQPSTVAPTKRSTTKLSTPADYVEQLRQAQHTLTTTARNLQQQHIDAYLAKSPGVPTTLTEGDHVLVAYPQRPPTKLHSRWKGPFIVTAHVRDNVYQVQSLVDFAYQEIHLDRLRLYAPDVNCDSSLVASWDSEEFQIDHISQHTGTPRKRTAMTFLVRWLNYGEESDSWEPYAHLKHTTAFDTYAKLHNLSF
jgi:hypothetical protein